MALSPGQLLCSAVQKALFEEEEEVRTLSLKVRTLEKANGHLREKVKTLKRLLRQARQETTAKQTHNLKQLYQADPQSHPDQDTRQGQGTPRLKKGLPKTIRD